MTDPLSIAAGTAGLISLGIQVTQSLVKFYTSYKHLDADIDGTLRNLESLQVILETLQTSISARKYNSEERGLVASIESHVKTCEESIQELQNECDKFSKHFLSRDKIKAAIRSAGRRATYPFRQSTLHKLGEDIDEIKSNLTLAMGTLGIADNSKIQNDLADVKTTTDLVKNHQKSSELESWLEAPDATIDHNNACSKKHQGTGIWLVKDPRFKHWLADANSFMWLNGFAGSGKSVLCSTAIQSVVRHRGTDRSIGVAFFYFKFTDDSKQDDSSMLRALLVQLSHQLQDGHRDLLQLHQTFRSGTPPPQALIAYLRRLIERFQDVYIMLDALDESPRDGPREPVLDALETIRKWNLQGLHLFVTSRNERDIQEHFGGIGEGHVTMRNEGTDNDIANFISGYLGQNRSLRKWVKYHDKIQEGLAMRANGVFRWVECQLKSLQSCPCSPSHLDGLLRSLPKSLDETYERMLCKIPSYLVGDARRILTLLCFATRPLKVGELIDAAAVEIKEPVGLQKDRRMVDYNDISDICPGFTELNAHTDETDEPSGEYVQIAHFSVQEYLISDRIREHKAAVFSLDSAAANAEITQVCLVYLLERDLSTLICDEYNVDGERLTLDDRLENYPLAKFAAESWYQQYKNMTADTLEVQYLISKLFHQNGTNINWLGLHDKQYKSGILQSAADLLGEAASPVYYASLLGLHGTLHAWFDGCWTRSQADRVKGPYSMPKLLEMVNAEGGRYGYPLVAASASGHLEVMQLLLANVADINACGRCGTALYRAAKMGEQGVRLLLDNGADVNAQGSPGNDTPLQIASLLSTKETVQLLLETGADVNAQGECLGNALQAASHRRTKNLIELMLEDGGNNDVQNCDRSDFEAWEVSKEIIQLLLDSGADVHAQGGEFGNALQAACFSSDSKEIVQLLLDSGADVHAQGGYYDNALQAACYSNGSKEIVQLLLDSGADVHAQGGRHGNALQAALDIGNAEVIQLLLENGADANTQGAYYASTIQAAVSQGQSKDTIEKVLENGADINAQGGEYGNASQAASKRGHKEVVQLPLENGADINAQGAYYASTIQAAVSQGQSKDTIEKLLENGADINAQGGWYGNALQAASKRGHKEVVQLLLRKGADVNAQGGRYSNALQAASHRGYKEVIQLLLENGADINAQGGWYGNALQAASKRGHKEVVQLLLRKGADINAQGGKYGNALQAASCRGQTEVVQLLLRKGADINAQGGKYGNALNAAIASRHGNTETVQLLLRKGADINAQGGKYGNALNALQASEWCRYYSQDQEEIIRLLQDHGAVEQPRV